LLSEDPTALFATIVNVYAVSDARPWNVYGLEDVVTDYVDGVVVIVNEDADADPDGTANVSVTAPPVPAAFASDVVLAVAKYGLLVPTSTAEAITTASG
jgi:hypothetical protein